jgi:hypothetical protein
MTLFLFNIFYIFIKFKLSKVKNKNGKNRLNLQKIEI